MTSSKSPTLQFTRAVLIAPATLFVLAAFFTMTLVCGCSRITPAPSPGIPNGDFENWDNGPVPTAWQTNSCPECVPPFPTYIVQRDTSAYHGHFAAKLIYNGVYPAWVKNSFPVPYHPSTLRVFVRSALAAGDTISIRVKLFNRGAIADSGQWLGLRSMNTYTPILIPITQSSMQADTALIFIEGGNKASYPDAGTVFWVDYLNLQ